MKIRPAHAGAEIFMEIFGKLRGKMRVYSGGILTIRSDSTLKRKSAGDVGRTVQPMKGTRGAVGAVWIKLPPGVFYYE